MLFIIGTITVIVCTLGGYAAMGGKLYVLWQPFEVVIIVGAALGGFIISSSKEIMVGTGKAMGGTLMGGTPFKKDDYQELLVMLFSVFKMARTKGALALEAHVENPTESDLFKKYPTFYKNKEMRTFLCDYLRLITMGTTNVHQMEELMEQEIEAHHEESHQISHAVITMADSMPALGIVAAVLGVIKTMGSINEPPEVLGKLIGGALVGTFLGVWISYGFLAPMGRNIGDKYDAESRYMRVMKVAILAYLQGHAPQVAVEFARKNIFHEFRPSFYEIEDAVSNVSID